MVDSLFVWGDHAHSMSSLQRKGAVSTKRRSDLLMQRIAHATAGTRNALSAVTATPADVFVLAPKSASKASAGSERFCLQRNE
jgi:hypothetical protein